MIRIRIPGLRSAPLRTSAKQMLSCMLIRSTRRAWSFRWSVLRSLDPRVGKVEAIHHLVVIVARGFDGIAGKLGGVCSLKVDGASAILVEEWVMRGIVK